ncbi:hypothetical protein GQ44DRAFT_617309 [Phaeosphaeriaceae sp. PMI808]|nr:hypothetical protein GQ44DRAFT_617309 [Phaeosphaeriaceae sp. PMI808]
MSAEEGSTQPPTAGNERDKTQATKSTATFSSFINKNTTGKKFAPKAARRRFGAVSTAPVPTPSAKPAPPNVEVQLTPITIAQLPTPTTTQEIAQQVPPGVSELDDTAKPITAPGLPSPVIQATRPTREHVDIVEAPEQGRIEPPTVENDFLVDLHATIAPTESAQEQLTSTQLQQEPSSISTSEQTTAVVEGSIAITVPGSVQPILEETGSSQSQNTGVLSWATVNRPNEGNGEEQENAPAAPRKTRQPPKPRRRKAAAQAEIPETTQQENDLENEAQPTPRRPSAKGRGKRKAEANGFENNPEAPAPAKRTRRPRKAKKQDIADVVEAEERETEEQGEGEEIAPRRKPRQPHRKRKSTTEAEGEGNQDSTQPKRKGRPPREATPSDAEDQRIDPENTFMDSLASRNIRVGKLSDRERAMRDIDWVAVRQRQREEDARPIQTKEAREAAEKIMAEEAPQVDGPRYHVVDGIIQVIHDSTTVNREAEADREIENYETVEERDLTTRITSRSFLKNNKRFPNDFILPGQGKRWGVADTELFYQGLRSFGTDFQMISQMFPGATRRSIKLKFTREERENPTGVREALLGQSQIVSHWDTFIKASQMEEEEFADADEIKRQMAEEEAEMRERIAAAHAETLERKRQQKEAGVLDDEGEGNEASNKESGKRKRKGKEKQVTFEEEGVEIVGAIDEDATWG